MAFKSFEMFFSNAISYKSLRQKLKSKNKSNHSIQHAKNESKIDNTRDLYILSLGSSKQN